MNKISIFWHRRDLRIEDNAGLYHALKQSPFPVLSLFIFDTNILDNLERKDARLSFIHDNLLFIKKQLQSLGTDILIKKGKPIDVWNEIIEQFNVQEVYTNRDYESYAIQRDDKVNSLLINKNILFKTYKDHIIFEKDEVLKNDGTPYTVFTPFSKKWKLKLEEKQSLYKGTNISYYLKPYPNYFYQNNYLKVEKSLPFPSLNDLGFEESDIPFPKKEVKQGLIKTYDKTRNFPAIEGTSKLGVHFRFGTRSIRQAVLKAQNLNETYLNELIWRDFYSNILQHFPHVEHNAFRSQYDAIPWRNDENDFEAWCLGKTGYPIVDAGMRELKATGYMHNRVRMICASFLTKHLLIDWRWGEAHFAKYLLDYDLASNNGGWQWAAGCGTDAAPYFRIFNPYSQQQKFDNQFQYIKKWIPEWNTEAYPEAIVEHSFARKRCLETYQSILKK